MRIAIVGAGTVGRTLGTAFAGNGHDVVLGSRAEVNPVAQEWVGATQGTVSATNFVGAVTDAEIVVNTTPGLVSVDVMAPLVDLVTGATVIDVSNPLDFSGGFPPAVRHPEGRSVGEQLQHALPESAVVKALNTVTASVMVDPSQLGDLHSLFVCGDDDAAKATVSGLLGEFGWGAQQIVDLGDITAARAMEAYLPLWLRLMGTLGTPVFNVAVIS